MNGGGRGGGEDIPKDGDRVCVEREGNVEGLNGAEFILPRVERALRVDGFGDIGIAGFCNCELAVAGGVRALDGLCRHC